MTNPYRFKTKPYAHQVKALRKLLADPAKVVGGHLPMDMGTGKTKVAIDYAGIQEQLGIIKQVLVLCPIDAMGVWNLEVLKHSGSETLDWFVMNYDRTFRYSIERRNELGEVTSVTEVDNFTALADYCNEAPTLLICDESDELANPATKRSKASYILSKLCPRVLMMSGTPVRKHPLDLFAQYRGIDEAILGGNWAVFRRMYGVWGGYGGGQLLYPINTKQLFKKIQPYSYPVKIEDCFDMPRMMPPEIIPVQLVESREIYDKFAATSIIQLEDMEFEATIILTLLLRLRQLTGGWLVGSHGKKRVGHEKEKTLKSRLETMYRGDIQKICIFATFLDDMRTCARVAKEVGYHVIPFWGGLKREQRERFIAHFEEIDRPTVWLAQSTTGTRSIPLTAAHHTIYYSLTDRYVHFEQSMRRTWRHGQQYPCSYYVLSAESSVDEALWLALRTKRSFAKLVHEDPDLIR
jgi:SNF2 family DNA or RNA helicase